MAPFFGTAASATTLLYLGILLGLAPGNHLILGLTTAITAVCLHCLLFAILTGAGKDTRLLVEDHSLDPAYVKRMKALKFEVFPPALYAIFAVLVVTSLGGARSSFATPWLAWAHVLVAWGVFLYNSKVFWMEYRAIRENARLLAKVNDAAAARNAVAEPAEQYEWGTHVYALGRFLTFLGCNTWLPYLYLRFIVGYFELPLWPFVGLSAVFFAGGFYLKRQYRDFRPGLTRGA